MAMIDYGAVTKKNGVNIQNKPFLNMKETLGFEIEFAPDYSGWHSDDGSKDMRIEGNYFSYCGNKECFLCFYKTFFIVVENGTATKAYWYGEKSGYNKKFSKETLKFKNGTEVVIKSIDGCGKFVATYIDADGMKWECLYGYGIDCDKEVLLEIQGRYNYTRPIFRKVLRFMGCVGG